jgi:hypothetical protein
VLDVREQEEMFIEFVTELARKEQEERRANRKKGITAFNEMLDEVKGITHASRWLDFRAQLEERGDSRFDAIDENERRNVFSDRVAELRKEYDQMMKEKERKKREEEKARCEEFRLCLMDKVKEGSIKATSTWGEARADLEKESTYIALADQPSSTPRRIFLDVVEILEKAWKSDRQVIEHVQFKYVLYSLFHLSNTTSSFVTHHMHPPSKLTVSSKHVG